MKLRTLSTVIALAVVAALLLPLPGTAPPPQAQGYSGAAPAVSEADGVSLRAIYTAGTITNGGATQAITADATGLLTTASQSSCAAPGYTSCNIIYWTSGTALATTTAPATAFASGNVVVAFVTTDGTDILTVVPASRNIANTRGLSGLVSTAGSYVVPATGCFGKVSGNADTANATYALGGTSAHVEFQLLSTATGTNTHTYYCDITPPTYITAGGGASITSVDFFYGAQTTNLGTQVVSEAAGTLNSVATLVFVDFPVASAAETSSTEAPTRADAGTQAIVGEENVTATTAGRYYTLNFAPATAVAVETARRRFYLQVALLNTATSATETNSVGARVNYSISR